MKVRWVVRYQTVRLLFPGRLTIFARCVALDDIPSCDDWLAPALLDCMERRWSPVRLSLWAMEHLSGSSFGYAPACLVHVARV